MLVRTMELRSMALATGQTSPRFLPSGHSPQRIRGVSASCSESVHTAPSGPHMAGAQRRMCNPAMD